MSEAKVTFTADAATAVAEMAKIEKANDRIEQEMSGMVKTSRQLAAEERKRIQEGIRLSQQHETAQERYNRKVEEARSMWRHGVIDSKTLNRELASQRDHLRNGAAGADKTGNALGAMGARALAAVGGISALTMAMRAGIQEHEKYQQATEQNILKLDEQERKFAIAAGLQGLQSKEARNRIMNVAHANAVTTEQAFSAATQLESAGFAAPQQTGTLDAFLKIMASGGLKDADPAASVESMAKFMESFGMDKSQANMLDMGVRMRGLKDTLVQVSDLSEFSKAAPVFSGSGVSVQDTLSTLTILRDTMSAGEAATGGRNIVQSLASAGATRTGKDALGELGLDISDVDLVGETLVEALGRVKAARDMLPEEQRATVMTRLFQRENVAAANIVMDNLDKFQSLGAAQGDRGSFVQGVQVAQSGVNAELNRVRVLRMMDDAEREEKSISRTLANERIDRLRANQDAAAGDNSIKWALNRTGNAFVDAGIKLGVVNREGSLAGGGAMQNPAMGDFTAAKLDQLLDVNKRQLAAQQFGNQAQQQANKKPAMNPTLLNNAPR